MSTENRVLDLAFEANEDLSNDQYRFVVIDATTGKVRRPDAANEKAIGVLQNAPAAGEAAVVRVEGVSKLQAAAGGLTLNSMITAEYVSAADAGKGLITTTAGDYVRGIVIGAAAAEDDLGSVRLVDFHYAIT